MNRFIVIVTQYNFKEYINRCLDSIMNQDYPNFIVVVVDDCSTDGTWEIANEYDVVAIKNEKREHSGPISIKNGLEAVLIENEDIIVLVSGDDYLADNHVLSHLNEIYTEDVWLSYGQFVPLSGNYGPYCKPIPDIKTYRKSTDWVTSHLLTFRRWLWAEIDDEDLKYNGEYTKYASDAAFMYPMIEMAGANHIKFVERILYVYNDMNPNCLFRLNPKDSIAVSEYFKNKPSYKELECL